MMKGLFWLILQKVQGHVASEVLGDNGREEIGKKTAQLKSEKDREERSGYKRKEF